MAKRLRRPPRRGRWMVGCGQVESRGVFYRGPWAGHPHQKDLGLLTHGRDLTPDPSIYPCCDRRTSRSRRVCPHREPACPSPGRSGHNSPWKRSAPATRPVQVCPKAHLPADPRPHDPGTSLTWPIPTWPRQPRLTSAHRSHAPNPTHPTPPPEPAPLTCANPTPTQWQPPPLPGGRPRSHSTEGGALSWGFGGVERGERSVRTGFMPSGECAALVRAAQVHRAGTLIVGAGRAGGFLDFSGAVESCPQPQKHVGGPPRITRRGDSRHFWPSPGAGHESTHIWGWTCGQLGVCVDGSEGLRSCTPPIGSIHRSRPVVFHRPASGPTSADAGYPHNPQRLLLSLLCPCEGMNKEKTGGVDG
jgi:hypothetical protein